MRAAVLFMAFMMTLTSLGYADDEATRAAVRKLGYEGVAHYEAGEYPQAVDKLERAYRVRRVPTLGLWSARALVKVGRWVEASERYFDVSRMPSPELERAVHEAAKVDAARERAALVPRIPKITIVLRGDTEDARVSIDGRAIASALLDAAIPINPGAHTVAVTRSGAPIKRRDVELRERGQLEIILDVPAREAAPPPLPATPPPEVPSHPPGAAVDDGRVQRTIGWATLGFGGAAALLGGVLGIVTVTKASELDCPESGCHPDDRDDVALINRLRTPATGWLIAGGVGLAAGAVVLLTAPGSTGEIAVSPMKVTVTARW